MILFICMLLMDWFVIMLCVWWRRVWICSWFLSCVFLFICCLSILKICRIRSVWWLCLMCWVIRSICSMLSCIVILFVVLVGFCIVMLCWVGC